MIKQTIAYIISINRWIFCFLLLINFFIQRVLFKKLLDSEIYLINQEYHRKTKSWYRFIFSLNLLYFSSEFLLYFPLLFVMGSQEYTALMYDLDLWLLLVVVLSSMLIYYLIYKGFALININIKQKVKVIIWSVILFSSFLLLASIKYYYDNQDQIIREHLLNKYVKYNSWQIHRGDIWELSERDEYDFYAFKKYVIPFGSRRNDVKKLVKDKLIEENDEYLMYLKGETKYKYCFNKQNMFYQLVKIKYIKDIEFNKNKIGESDNEYWFSLYYYNVSGEMIDRTSINMNTDFNVIDKNSEMLLKKFKEDEFQYVDFENYLKLLDEDKVWLNFNKENYFPVPSVEYNIYDQTNFYIITTLKKINKYNSLDGKNYLLEIYYYQKDVHINTPL